MRLSPLSVIFLLAAGPASLLSRAETSGPVALREVAIVAKPAREIGAEISKIDSAALRSSVAQSLAEVIGFNSAAFIKNFGRATTSTLSFRGTAASHTQVTWNGMRISSPMLGSTDFSTLPSFFIDRASLVHGSSSLADVGGGLGGLVKLESGTRTVDSGLHLNYIQGIGSWHTFDEFLGISAASGPWKLSARASYSSSRNDFAFTNYARKENNYDDNHQIISSYYPRQRNRSGAFRDFNAMVSASYQTASAGRWSLDSWYTSDNRQLPLTLTEYSADERQFDNRQREQTIRAVASWDKYTSTWRLGAKAGYIHSWTAYDYWIEAAPEVIAILARSRTHQNTAYAHTAWEYFPSPRWLFTAEADLHYQQVRSADLTPMATGPGYSHSRPEISAAISARWRPATRLGIGAICRQEAYGSKSSAPIPALFADYILIPALTAKISGSRNLRFPTLNDLYTIPGGNPDLKPETGWTYDAGLSSATHIGSTQISASANWFDSYISDWILWLPSPRGFYVPRNIRSVHAYGIEASASCSASLPQGVTLSATAHYTWSASINRQAIAGQYDKSAGKQLPYIPRHSASATISAAWRRWEIRYMIQAYSERFTMASNETTFNGHLPAYTVSNLTAQTTIPLPVIDLQLKLAVNNLFNTEYQTVLSRPMPGINFEAFLGIKL